MLRLSVKKVLKTKKKPRNTYILSWIVVFQKLVDYYKQKRLLKMFWNLKNVINY